MNIKIICRKERICNDGTAPIFLRFTHDRKSRYESLGVAIPPKAWEQELQTINPNYPKYKELQFKIDSKLLEYRKKIARLEALDTPITFENLLETATNTTGCTVGAYFERTIERLKSVDKLGSASKHQVTLALLTQFGRVDIRFEELNYTYLNDFEHFLMRKGNKSNSIATKFSVLKATYNKALAEYNFVPRENPFAKFKVGRLWTTTQKRSITKEEVHKLMALELPKHKSPYLEFARDIFLFSYFMAGINFKDIATLKYSDVVNGRLYYARHKTSKAMNCPLSSEAQSIVVKYHKNQADEDYLFPILDKAKHITERQQLDRIHKVLAKVNERLGDLGALVGLKINLTTYVARHTFATVLKRSGVNVAIISESLGHSDLKTTQIYLDSFENTQIDEAMKHLL